MASASRLFAGFIGAVLLSFGLGLTALAAWMVERQMTLRGAIQPDAAVFIVVAGLISLFCLLVGFRLAFNRPNRYGSILSPTGWAILAILFALISCATFLLAVFTRGYVHIAGSIFAAWFAYKAFQARTAAMNSPRMAG